MSFSFAVKEKECHMKESVYKSNEKLQIFLNAKSGQGVE